MKELNTDQKEYLITILKKQQQSNRLAAAVFIIVSIVAAANLLNSNGVSGLSLSNELILPILIIGAFFLLGFFFMLRSWNLTIPMKMEELSGTYTFRSRKRITYSYIDGVNVIIPPVWCDYFQRNEEYTVEGVYSKGITGALQFIILKIHDLPDQEKNFKIMQMLEAKKFLISKTFSFYFLIPVVFVAVLVSLVNYLFFDLQFQKKLSHFVMSTSIHEIKIYGVLALLALVGVIVLVIKWVSYLTNRNIQVDLTLSWKDWLIEYQQFMEKEMMPLMNADRRKRNPDVFMNLKNTLSKNKRFKLEYKMYKKELYGFEKDEFVKAMKTMHRNIRTIR